MPVAGVGAAVTAYEFFLCEALSETLQALCLQQGMLQPEPQGKAFGLGLRITDFGEDDSVVQINADECARRVRDGGAQPEPTVRDIDHLDRKR